MIILSSARVVQSFDKQDGGQATLVPGTAGCRTIGSASVQGGSTGARYSYAVRDSWRRRFRQGDRTCPPLGPHDRTLGKSRHCSRHRPGRTEVHQRRRPGHGHGRAQATNPVGRGPTGAGSTWATRRRALATSFRALAPTGGDRSGAGRRPAPTAGRRAYRCPGSANEGGGPGPRGGPGAGTLEVCRGNRCVHAHLRDGPGRGPGRGPGPGEERAPRPLSRSGARTHRSTQRVQAAGPPHRSGLRRHAVCSDNATMRIMTTSHSGPILMSSLPSAPATMSAAMTPNIVGTHERTNIRVDHVGFDRGCLGRFRRVGGRSNRSLEPIAVAPAANTPSTVTSDRCVAERAARNDTQLGTNTRKINNGTHHSGNGSLPSADVGSTQSSIGKGHARRIAAGESAPADLRPWVPRAVAHHHPRAARPLPADQRRCGLIVRLGRGAARPRRRVVARRYRAWSCRASPSPHAATSRRRGRGSTPP